MVRGVPNQSDVHAFEWLPVGVDDRARQHHMRGIDLGRELMAGTEECGKSGKTAKGAKGHERQLVRVPKDTLCYRGKRETLTCRMK